MGKGHYELGRIYVNPDFQNRRIGQQAVRQMLGDFPEAKKWTLGTPSWAVRNQHFYEKMGFVKVGETEVDPHLGWSGVEYEKRCPRSLGQGEVACQERTTKPPGS